MVVRVRSKMVCRPMRIDIVSNRKYSNTLIAYTESLD